MISITSRTIRLGAASRRLNGGCYGRSTPQLRRLATRDSRSRALMRLAGLYNVMLMPSQIKKEAADGAAKLLEAADWPKGLFPIDPVYIARRVGAEVTNVRLDADILGALIKPAGGRPTILINENDSQNRQRFTCAHELGHFVRRSPSWGQQVQEPAYLTLEAMEATEYETVDLRSQASSQGDNPEEIYANEFAACLLMPAELVRPVKGEVLGVLASRFAVSEEAMAYRLKNLEAEGAEKKRLLSLG
jgi:hypothetical protein